MLEQYIHAIEITCLPNDLPETLEFDVTHLAEGDSLHISDVTLPAGVRATHAPEVVIAHVGKQGSGTDETEVTPAAGAAAAPAAGTPSAKS